MPTNRIGKQNISIKAIGLQRFWIGMVSGLITAVVLSFSFNYSREIYRVIASSGSDLLIQSPENFQFFNNFYGALSAVLGFSITLWIWVGNNKHQSRNSVIYKQVARINAVLAFWIVLSAISRFGSILYLTLFSFRGYDNQLDFREEFWLLFVLLPLVVFAQSWHSVRMLYKSLHWIFYSAVATLLLGFILAHSNPVQQEVNNAIYANRYKTEYQYIESELKRAKKMYNIKFSDSTKTALYNWHRESSVNQLYKLQAAFNSNRKVTLDSIILEKIVQHNLKRGYFYRDWSYAQPYAIYNQIKKYGAKDSETLELFLLLNNQIEMWNTPPLEWRVGNNYSHYRIKRSIFAMDRGRYFTKEKTELITARNLLLADSNYQAFFYLLPYIIEEK